MKNGDALGGIDAYASVVAAVLRTEEDVDEMLNLVIHGTDKVPTPDASWLAGHNTFWFKESDGPDEDAFFNLRSGEVLRMDPGARQALDVLAFGLMRLLGLPLHGVHDFNR